MAPAEQSGQSGQRVVAGDPHTAEDLLQDSLVRVLHRWGSIREGAATDAYVRRTITRQHISSQRRPWRRATLHPLVADPALAR